ncbi:BHLH domain-containing protein [Trichonephila clavipes]|nr:BHLH domain-containing protein [Trichonephila clavipes]
MAQFEPSRVLENAIGIDNEQQYVEIGSNTYLGTKDGIRYALFPTSDNKVRLCEIPSDPPSNEAQDYQFRAYDAYEIRVANLELS